MIFKGRLRKQSPLFLCVTFKIIIQHLKKKSADIIRGSFKFNSSKEVTTWFT